MWWILYGYYVMFICGCQNSWFSKAFLRICYLGLIEYKGSRMLKTYKLPCVEQRITKLERKSTMFSFVKLSHTFMFSIFSVFNTFYLHIHINYWQVLFITGTIRKIVVCNFHF